MGIFSSRQEPKDHNGRQMSEEDAFSESLGSDAAELDAITTPHDIKLQEKLRSLDGLKGRAARLEESLIQFKDLMADSENTVNQLSTHIDQSRLDAEDEKRLQAENAKLSTENLNKDHAIRRLEDQVENYRTEREVQTGRFEENRMALEKTRVRIMDLSEQKVTLCRELETTNNQLAETKSELSTISDSHDSLTNRNEHLENRKAELKAELEEEERQQLELQQALTETTATLDEEIKRNKSLTQEFELSKRELSDVNARMIEAKSEIESLNHDLEHAKFTLEEERRKFDDRSYGLNTEIQNLASSNSVLTDTLKNTKKENSGLKSTVRDVEKRLKQTEADYKAARLAQENDRKSLVESNSKLSELSVRYNAAMIENKRSAGNIDKMTNQIQKLNEENLSLNYVKEENRELVEQINEAKALISEYQSLIDDHYNNRVEFESSSDFDIDDNEKVVRLRGGKGR